MTNIAPVDLGGVMVSVISTGPKFRAFKPVEMSLLVVARELWWMNEE
jgi:hypothetical protein